MVCTSKVVSAETRKDYEAWLVDGKRLIEEVLRDKDCQAGLAVGEGADVQHRFSWVHFPAPSSAKARETTGKEREPPFATSHETSSHTHKRLTRAAGSASMSHVRHSGAPECETVAVVFQRHDDLERWRHSRRRAAWLARGERFGDDGGGSADGKGLGLSARATSIDVDDGSLGGWLPADANANKQSESSKSSPSAWKVYLAVLLAQYPLVELNALFLLPLMDSVELFRPIAELPQPARMLLVQSWTSFGAVFVTLPATQFALRKTGFLEAGAMKNANPALGAASVAVSYAVVLAAAFAAQPHAAVAAETLAKILSRA